MSALEYGRKYELRTPPRRELFRLLGPIILTLGTSGACTPHNQEGAEANLNANERELREDCEPDNRLPPQKRMEEDSKVNIDTLRGETAEQIEKGIFPTDIPHVTKDLERESIIRGLNILRVNRHFRQNLETYLEANVIAHDLAEAYIKRSRLQLAAIGGPVRYGEMEYISILDAELDEIPSIVDYHIEELKDRGILTNRVIDILSDNKPIIRSIIISQLIDVEIPWMEAQCYTTDAMKKHLEANIEKYLGQARREAEENEK